MEFISIKNCYKVYKNGVTALADANLSIEPGEFVFLIGHTASGKSTLLKLLYREEKPNKGEVLVGGINVSKLRNSSVYKLRRKIGIVFQDFKLLPKLTVFENVAYPLSSFGASGSEIKEKVIKAIVNEPKLIVCDEPTGNLDPDTSKEVMDVLVSINKEMGSTIVMATHDKDIVNRMKKRVVTIKDGVIISDKEKGKYNDEVDKNNK